jgi:Protein of unknown function (DUF3224)
MKPAHSRRRTIVALTATAITLALSATTADARPDPARQPHRLRYTTSAQLVGGDVHCDPTTADRCIPSFQNVWTYDGDIRGTSFAAGTAALGPDGLYHGVAIELFTGSVEGCGDGTLVIRQIGTLDPATGTSEGSWTIVAGAGTGDLAGATGGSTSGRTGEPARAVIRC